MALPQAKTFKLKTRTNMHIPVQTKAAFAQQQQPAAQPAPNIPMPATTQPLPENLTGKPVFVPYQHIPPNQPQQARPLGQQQLQQQQQGAKTQQAPIQGRLIQRRPPAPPPATPVQQQYAQPPPPQQQQYAPPPPVAVQPPQQPISPPQYQPPQFAQPPAGEQEIDPEASIKEISLNPAYAPFAQQKSPAPQKTGVYNIGEPNKGVPAELQKILENEAENYKDQVQAYVDVCDILSKPGWQLADIVDYIHMLVRSVNLDVLSIVVTDPSEKGKFLPVASRGFKSSPSSQVVSCWLPAISEEGTIIWDELLEAALDKKNKLAKWITREGLNFVGYVPLHDNKKIYGFLFVAVASDKKAPSALASPLLELCGGRIGLVLESRRSIGSLPEKASQTVKLVQDHLAMLTSYLEILKISAKINPEEVVSTAEKCLKTISESKKMINLFADQVISTSEEKKN